MHRSTRCSHPTVPVPGQYCVVSTQEGAMVSTVCTVLRAGHRPPHRTVSTAHDAAAGAVHLGDRVQQHEHLHDRLVPDALGGRLQDMSSCRCHPGTCRATAAASQRRADRCPGTRITPTLPTPDGPPAHEQVGRVREAGVRLVRAVAPRAEAPNRERSLGCSQRSFRKVWGHRKPTKARGPNERLFLQS